MLVAAAIVFSRTKMARKMAMAGCILFGIGASGFTTPPTARTEFTVASSTKTFHVIAFGSSSTEGIGASKPASTYPAQLQTVLRPMMPAGRDVEVLNRGIGGQDVDDMMNRLQADVIAPRPDVVIWQTGSNDPLRHVPLDRFERETRAGIQAMHQAGIAVILMEPQWCPKLEASGNVDAFRDAIRRIGGELSVPVIHRADLMRHWIAEGRMTPAQMLAPDGLHMADNGYAQLAVDIAPMVLRAGTVTHVKSAALQAR